MINYITKANVTLAVSLISLFLTAWYYTRMVRLTQRLQQANTLGIFHSELASPVILDATELIEDFIEERGVDQYAQDFLLLRNQKDSKGRMLDRARRRLVHWFSKLEYFDTFGFLTREYLLAFPGADRARYFIDVVEPLEYVSRKATGRSHATVFDFLRIVYNFPPSTISQRLSHLFDDGNRGFKNRSTILEKKEEL